MSSDGFLITDVLVTVEDDVDVAFGGSEATGLDGTINAE